MPTGEADADVAEIEGRTRCGEVYILVGDGALVEEEVMAAIDEGEALLADLFAYFKEWFVFFADEIAVWDDELEDFVADFAGKVQES